MERLSSYTEGGCKIFRPIRPTIKDVEVLSDSLVEQILRHNVTGQIICDWPEELKSKGN